VKAMMIRARRGRQQHVRFVDRADAGVDDPIFTFSSVSLVKVSCEHFRRALHGPS